jgi:MFS family permease
MLAARIGPRTTVGVGLLLLACSTVAFGVLHSAPALDLARIVEGVGGACSWAGGLAWIVAEAPVERRGELIGRALGAAIGGALFGPAVGALAGSIGRPVSFSALGALALGLIAVTRSLPDPEHSTGQGLRTLRASVRRRPMLIGLWLMTLPAVASGMIEVLGPLRLHAFGASALVVGATWLVGAGLQATLAPAVGRVSDRRGRAVPLRAGLLAAALTLACFTLATAVVPLALTIVATFIALGVFWAPAMALLSDAGAAVGLDRALAVALINLMWAGGQIVGSAGGGAIAADLGDAVPMTAVAAACLLTALLSLGAGPVLRLAVGRLEDYSSRARIHQTDRKGGPGA